MIHKEEVGEVVANCDHLSVQTAGGRQRMSLLYINVKYGRKFYNYSHIREFLYNFAAK
jgi:hypothetical protein